MKNTLMQMQGITKRFYSVTALKDVDITLYEGEILAIVGENGAGKSTLMKILSGSYSSDSYDGDIFIHGQKVHFRTTADAERSGIQMIYQEISLFPDLSVAENIFVGNLPDTHIKGFVDFKKTNRLCLEALAKVGLQVRPEEMVRRLSTSQQQLLSIAKALYRQPKILVLDEPSSALTESETTVLLEIISGLRDQGISCIYISHKLDEVFSIADRVLVLRDGQTVATYDRAGFVPERIIGDMVGRKIEDMYPKTIIPFGAEMLRVENMTVPSRIAGRNAVEDVSFSVRQGEILGIGGLVGAGRSELVNAIFGSIRSTAGKVFIKGSEVHIGSPVDAIRHRIGLVTEDRKASGFVGTMNIRENISLASFDKIFGRTFIKPKLERESTHAFARQLNVKAPSIEQSILTLSGGNQQKVVLAKWLMSDVEILFLDEPTRGIDIGAKVEIYNIMTELAKKGVAIVMISSELPELLAMCDNFIILAEGKVKGRFNRDEICQQNYMKAATGIC